MKLAHLVPLSMLPVVHHQAAHLCLSNLVIRSELYAEFHRRQVVEGKLVLLDNPVHEDEPIRIDEWLEAARLIKPTVVVIPDVIDDWEATVKLAKEYRHEVRKVSPRSHLMAVPHGVEHADFLACARQLSALRDPAITWFGVSLERRLNDDPLALTRRFRRIRILRTEPEVCKRNVHLLGISEQAVELRSPTFAHCVSADTSKFATWALTDNPVFPPPPVRLDYPGRSALGGPLKYFEYDPPPGFNIGELYESLTAWSNYAEGIPL
jgi:hypothetical protein